MRCRRFALSEFLRSFIYTSVLQSSPRWFPLRRSHRRHGHPPFSQRFSFLQPTRVWRVSLVPHTLPRCLCFCWLPRDSVLSWIAISSWSVCACFFLSLSLSLSSSLTISSHPFHEYLTSSDWRIFCVNASGRKYGSAYLHPLYSSLLFSFLSFSFFSLFFLFFVCPNPLVRGIFDEKFLTRRGSGGKKMWLRILVAVSVVGGPFPCEGLLFPLFLLFFFSVLLFFLSVFFSGALVSRALFQQQRLPSDAKNFSNIEYSASFPSFFFLFFFAFSSFCSSSCT